MFHHVLGLQAGPWAGPFRWQQGPDVYAVRQGAARFVGLEIDSLIFVDIHKDKLISIWRFPVLLFPVGMTIRQNIRILCGLLRIQIYDYKIISIFNCGLRILILFLRKYLQKFIIILCSICYQFLVKNENIGARNKWKWRNS